MRYCDKHQTILYGGAACPGCFDDDAAKVSNNLQGVELMKTMTVKDIVRAWLKANECDGLCNPDADNCGCGIDSLVPCDYIGGDCVAAKKVEGYLFPVGKEFPSGNGLVCSACGESCVPSDGAWRYNGITYEHSHGQAGHFSAVRKEKK